MRIMVHRKRGGSKLVQFAEKITRLS